MNFEPQITDAWNEWIRTNLARGCSIESMITAMGANGFAPEHAQRCIQDVSARPQGGQQTVNQSRSDARISMVENVIKLADRSVDVSVRVEKPVILVLNNVLSPNECDELVNQSRAKLKRSTIVDPMTGAEGLISDRSSSGTFFVTNENPFIASLDERISKVMGMPVENGEGLQILHYQIDGEYKPHYDYFPPGDPGSKVHIARGGQRVSTMVIYLNEVEKGGETVFPNLNFSVVPKKGSAVYFEYFDKDGQVDPQTLHGGLPVLAGEKWIATKWMRQRKYG